MSLPQCSSFRNTLTARDIALTFGLKKQSNGYYGACPCCGYPKGFTVCEKNGKVLFYCHAGGCRADEILAFLKQNGLWRSPLQYTRQNLISEDSESNDKTRLALEIWDKAQPAKGTLVETYLKTRGITCPIPETLRFLPTCKHTPSREYYPAMVAMVTPWQGSPLVAIHRTYLKPDGSGKIDDTQAKMILGPVKGASVHLEEPENRLAIAEGLETALSVFQATGIPTWAALSAGGIQNLILPPWPKASEVIICTDHDPVGLKAASSTAERWVQEGRKVRIAKPPKAGTDFNDILLGDDDHNEQ